MMTINEMKNHILILQNGKERIIEENYCEFQFMICNVCKQNVSVFLIRQHHCYLDKVVDQLESKVTCEGERLRKFSSKCGYKKQKIDDHESSDS